MTKRICILGSGLVSSSVVHFFSERNNEVSVTVGSKVPCELEALQKRYPNITTITLDVTTDIDKLHRIITISDIVVSLLTNEMQVPIAKKCIELGVHMVHASYCTSEMQELDSLAKEKGVTVLNEIGLDPGIDHFLAMQAIDEIHAEKGAKVISFKSYCGGLPEPEISHCNPLRYKFSWSPRTALRNMLNPAKYLEANKIIEIPAGGALIDQVKDVDFFPGLQLEGYPNRDSLVYKDLYGLHEAQDVIRGTLRYKGNAKVVKTLNKLNLLNSEPIRGFLNDYVPTCWKDLLAKLTPNGNNCMDNQTSQSIKTLLRQNGFDNVDVTSIKKLGLLCDKPDLKLKDTLLDTLADYLSPRMSFDAGERDVVILRHEIKSVRSNGEVEIREIDFVAYGDQNVGGFSVMSKTVGLSIGQAAMLLLNGDIHKPGVVLPLTSDIYSPILTQLENHGLTFQQRITTYT